MKELKSNQAFITKEMMELAYNDLVNRKPMYPEIIIDPIQFRRIQEMIAYDKLVSRCKKSKLGKLIYDT